MHNRLLLVDGELGWDKPIHPDDWEVLINGHHRILAINCVFSEDQETPFRLYTTVQGNFFRITKNRLVRDNSSILKNPDQWKISSRILRPDRVGLTKFVGAPVLPLMNAWRQPFDPQWEFLFSPRTAHAELAMDKPNKVSIRLKSAPQIDMMVQWPGIFEEYTAQNPDAQCARGRTPCVRVREDFRNWLRESAKGRIYPFSDSKSTFENEDDEWTYMTDFHPALDSEIQPS